MTWELPDPDTLKALPHEDYQQFWRDATEHEVLGTAEERIGDIVEGDVVTVTFDSTQNWLGNTGTIRQVDPHDDAYPFQVAFEGDIYIWVTDVAPIPPFVVPEFSTIEDADRFLDSISKER